MKTHIVTKEGGGSRGCKDFPRKSVIIWALLLHIAFDGCGLLQFRINSAFKQRKCIDRPNHRYETRQDTYSLFIYLPINLSINQLFYLSINLCLYLIYLSSYLFIYLSISISINQLFYLSINLCLYLIYLSSYLFIYLSVYQYIYQPTFLSIYVSINLSSLYLIYLPIYLSIPLFMVYLTTLPAVHNIQGLIVILMNNKPESTWK
jgi:hypothetical protein